MSKYEVGDIVNCTAACTEGYLALPAKILKIEEKEYPAGIFTEYTVQYLPIEDVDEGSIEGYAKQKSNRIEIEAYLKRKE